MSIKQLRMRKGISQEQLAERLGISRSTLSRIETGKVKITDFFLADDIAAFFEIPVEILFPEFLLERKSPPIDHYKRGEFLGTTCLRQNEERHDSERVIRKNREKSGVHISCGTGKTNPSISNRG